MSSANGHRHCDCTMFQTEGICWHTGYVPTFRHSNPTPKKPVPARRETFPVVPEAFRRMHRARELEARLAQERATARAGGRKAARW